MNNKLHYLPEKPDYSCEVVTYHKSKHANNIYNVTNCTYSAKYGLFNCCDRYLADEIKSSEEFSETVYAWKYMDDVIEEVLG